MAKVVDPYYAKRAAAKGQAPAPQVAPATQISSTTLSPLPNLPEVGGGIGVLPGTPAPTDEDIRAKLAQNDQIVAGMMSDTRNSERDLEAFKASQPQFHGAPYAAPLDAATNARLRDMSRPISNSSGEFDPSSRRMLNLAAAGRQEAAAAPTPPPPTVAFDPKLMAQITANRQAAEAARASNLAGQGMSPEAIDARMFPQHGVVPDPMRSQARAVDFAERQGRVNASAMADRLMRQAHLNGQQMPMAQAYAIAMNQIGTTNPMNQGAVPSLPGMDPSRMAMFNPQGGAVAGQFQNGQGMNANAATRDQLQANTAQMGIAQSGQNHLLTTAQQILQSIMGNSLGQQQQNTNDAVARSAMGPSPQMQQQEAARQRYSAAINNPANRGRDRWDAAYAAQLEADRAIAYPPTPSVPGPYGASPAAPTAANPPTAPGQPPAANPPPSLSSAFTGQSPGAPVESFGNEMALNQMLAQLPEGERARMQAEWRIANGQASHPSVDAFYNGRFTADSPNLMPWMPDAFMHRDNKIRLKAEYMQQNYGLSPEVAMAIATRSHD